MSVIYWHEATRADLNETLPEALVIVPIGSVAQHGPHLPTGTDALIARTVVDMAAEEAAGREGERRPFVVVPALTFGASGEHAFLGGTLSLSAETLTRMLVELCGGIAASGGRLVVLLNAHAGNRGPCESAAAEAAAQHGLIVAHIDYWELVERPAADGAGRTVPPVPGHAGEFETALVASLYPELVGDAPRREAAVPVHGRGADPGLGVIPGVSLHGEALWRRLDGWTDEPTRASETDGKAWLEACGLALADRLAELSALL